jgi:RNA polymerase sigma factor (TIGR02999 family)
MSDITRILSAIDAGDPHAAEQLLPLVYAELRKLAAGYLASEAPGHTLDATALVHEAYLRLVANQEHERPENAPSFSNARPFFAAAAEAMRRLLVDHARRKRALKRGGPAGTAHLDLNLLPGPANDNDRWIDFDEALTTFARIDPSAAELAKLRVFGGLSVEEAAEALDLSRATAFRTWAYARAWLTAALMDKSESRCDFRAPITPCRVGPGGRCNASRSQTCS